MAQGLARNLTAQNLKLDLEGLLTDDWLSNLANFSATLFNQVPDINWCGFYLVREATGPEHLKLGPFQGQPACLDIPFSRGVCGAAARDLKIMRVDDVHSFPDHITCDVRSRSELVIPLISRKANAPRLIGVLDIDSPTPARFTVEDQKVLTELVDLLMEKTAWPTKL